MKLFGFLFIVLLCSQLFAGEDALYLGIDRSRSNLFSINNQYLTYSKDLNLGDTTYFSLKTLELHMQQREFPSQMVFNDYGANALFNHYKDNQQALYFGGRAYAEHKILPRQGLTVGYSYRLRENLIFNSSLTYNFYDNTLRNTRWLHLEMEYYSYLQFIPIFNFVENRNNDNAVSGGLKVGKELEIGELYYTINLGREINDFNMVDEFVSHTVSYYSLNYFIGASITNFDGKIRDENSFSIFFKRGLK